MSENYNADAPKDIIKGDCKKYICYDGEPKEQYDPNDIPVNVSGDGKKCFCDDVLKELKCINDTND
ncbi:MAG TPA: hypothetical protein PLC59_01205 [Bacteroidales bacterium]|nr:hypothetical protein [Bacteroidales bacterium]HQI44684.1 hypothetical protein [Bacteroidales bacterium]